MNHQGSKKIKTERLTLEKFDKNDSQEVYNNYGKDKKIRKYISWIPYDTLENTEKFIAFNLKEYESNPKHYSWKILLDDTIIGSIAIFNVADENDSGELGYSLGSKWWSKGYITEACNAVVDYAFDDICFNRIYASCHKDNIASEKVMKKIGMQYEGIMREGQKNLDESYSDLKLYSILKKDRK